MGELTIFECDVTGERFGARNDVFEFDVRQPRSASPFEIYTRTIHLCDEALDEFQGMYPHGLEYVGVQEGEIAGAKLTVGTNDHTQWEPRDSVLLESYEDFFEFVEEEVLY